MTEVRARAPLGTPPAVIDSLATLVRQRSGIALDASKLYLLQARLGPVMRRHGCADLAALAALRRAAPDPLTDEIVDAMTTNETLFFRDAATFAHFRDHTLPALFAARPAGQRLRVWSAACAAGQEPYSIAMTLSDAQFGTRSLDVLATDISATELARARRGAYTAFEVGRGLPPFLLARHFERAGGGWQVKPALRDAVAFRWWNLLDDPTPLGRFDVVFCRNVLLYFDLATRTRVLAGIARQLEPDGVLYLGGSETVLGLDTPFIRVPSAPALRLTNGAGSRPHPPAHLPVAIRSTNSRTVGMKLFE